MDWIEAFERPRVRIASRERLISRGATGRTLTSAVKDGSLIRARRDHYLLPSESRQVIEATRVGGRLACVSALADADIFAIETHRPHIHLEHSMARLRSPRSRFVPLHHRNRDGVELHWHPLFGEAETAHGVSIEDALAQSLRCQQPWHALASIDNALFRRAISPAAVPRIFENAPNRVQHLAARVDGRAESGQESILRMIVVEAGLHCDLQVVVPAVGRVDMVVEGCLVVEADSRLAHDGWERHVADRRRDLLLAGQHYMSLRPAYQHTLFEPGIVRRSVLGLLAQSRNFG